MFRKFYLIASIAALSLFSYAQHQGWNVFDNVAHAGAGPGG